MLAIYLFNNRCDFSCSQRLQERLAQPVHRACRFAIVVHATRGLWLACDSTLKAELLDHEITATPFASTSTMPKPSSVYDGSG